MHVCCSTTAVVDSECFAVIVDYTSFEWLYCITQTHIVTHTHTCTHINMFSHVLLHIAEKMSFWGERRDYWSYLSESVGDMKTLDGCVKIIQALLQVRKTFHHDYATVT